MREVNITLLERLRVAEENAITETLSLGQQIRTYLQHTMIGTLRLENGETMIVEIADGCISRSGEHIADIPSLDVLRSNDAIIQHLFKSTRYEVHRIEDYNRVFPTTFNKIDELLENPQTGDTFKIKGGLTDGLPDELVVIRVNETVGFEQIDVRFTLEEFENIVFNRLDDMYTINLSTRGW